MVLDKGVVFFNRDSDGYYFCKLCDKWHRVRTSIEGREHLPDYFDEETTNAPLARYYFCSKCNGPHRGSRKDHIPYRLYVKLEHDPKEPGSIGLESPSDRSLPETSHPSKEIMDVEEVIAYITAGIAERQKCLALASDRGIGDGMRIEKWLLVEMTARLIELRTNDRLDSVEGEHKYPIKKTSRYEHCDLWWRAQDREHWVEVKTVKDDKDISKVSEDLGKRNRLRDTDVFHHLSILFLRASATEYWSQQITSVYQENGLSCEADWTDPVEGNVRLQFMLFG